MRCQKHERLEDRIRSGNTVTRQELNKARYYPKAIIDNDRWLMYRRDEYDRSGVIIKQSKHPDTFVIQQYLTFE